MQYPPPYGQDPNNPTTGYGQYPPQQPPPNMTFKERMAYNQARPKSKAMLFGYGCMGLIALLVICGICGAISKATTGTQTTNTVQSASVQQSPTATPKPTEAPKPTPTPKPVPKVFFEQSNQSSGLSFANSTAFPANGTLKLSYSCLHSVKDGVDVQLNLLALTSDGLADHTAWAVKMECPDLGSDTVTVPNGQYKVTVATIGDVGWSLKITQG